jgi:hypothetical protein
MRPYMYLELSVRSMLRLCVSKAMLGDLESAPVVTSIRIRQAHAGRQGSLSVDFEGQRCCVEPAGQQVCWVVADSRTSHSRWRQRGGLWLERAEMQVRGK